MSRCPFEDYKPENEWFCQIYALCVGHVESHSPLSPIICDVFDIFYRYGTLMPLSPWDWGLKSQVRAWATSFMFSVGVCACICCRLHTPCTDCELACARISRCLHTPCTDCTVICAHIYRSQDVSGRKQERRRRSWTGRENVRLLPCWYSHMQFSKSQHTDTIWYWCNVHNVYICHMRIQCHVWYSIQCTYTSTNTSYATLFCNWARS